MNHVRAIGITFYAAGNLSIRKGGIGDEWQGHFVHALKKFFQHSRIAAGGLKTDDMAANISGEDGVIQASPAIVQTRELATGQLDRPGRSLNIECGQNGLFLIALQQLHGILHRAKKCILRGDQKRSSQLAFGPKGFQHVITRDGRIRAAVIFAPVRKQSQGKIVDRCEQTSSADEISLYFPVIGNFAADGLVGDCVLRQKILRFFRLPCTQDFGWRFEN